MKTSNFIIIGSGWRSLFYVRIAKALPKVFNLQALLCRTTEKAQKIAEENSIYTTTSIEECRKLNPDFVVVAVSKKDIFNVAKEWLDYGFTVLMETPVALDEKMVEEAKSIQKSGKKLVVAEQYIFYPEYSAILKLLKEKTIGSVDYLSISCAHEYHGSSLIRNFLGETELPQKITSKTFAFPTVETLSRYEKFNDGRISDKKRTIALFEFANKKVALYDFDSEQYRSPIRKNLLKIQGTKGEIHDRTVYYLDENNEAKESEIVVKSKIYETENKNPNLHFVKEIEKITFEGKTLYEPPFGLCGLSEDETAIAQVMESTAKYSKGEVENPIYTLEEAIMDSQMMIEMK